MITLSPAHSSYPFVLSHLAIRYDRGEAPPRVENTGTGEVTLTGLVRFVSRAEETRVTLGAGAWLDLLARARATP